MSRTPKPRVVFELDSATHKKAAKLAKADRLVVVESYHYDDNSGETRDKGDKETPVRIK